MKKVIAKVRLNPGQGGYFDPITRIHLTHGDPEKEVYAGMNTAGLKNAVRNKRITLVSGSLGEFVPPFKLIKQTDGKIILVPNTVVKTKQQEMSVKPVKSKELTSVNTKEKQKEQSSVDDIKVNVEKEPTDNNKSQDIVTVIKEEPIISVTDSVSSVTEESIDIKEDPVEHSDSKPFNSPFKKGKKKNSAKKDNEEQKPE